MLRCWNNEVLAHTDGALEVILSAIAKDPSPDSAFGRATLSPLRGARGSGALHDQ